MSLPRELSREVVVVDGLRLMTYRTQVSDRPALICIHGGPGFDARTLWPGMLHLAKIFDLIFVDLRGHGESEAPGDNDYSLEAYANDVIAIGITLKRPSGILGHSFGGCVVTEVLSSPDNGFQFGVLVDSPADDGWVQPFAKHIEKMNDVELIEARKHFSGMEKTDTNWKKFSLAFRRVYFPEIAETKAQALMETWIYRIAPYLQWSKDSASKINRHAACEKISAPCLIIEGDQDELIPRAQAETLHSHIKKSELKIMPGGHFPFISNPDSFSNLVAQWWATISPGVNV